MTGNENNDEDHDVTRVPELGWEIRAEFRRIPENFRFRTHFGPQVFRFRFIFRSDYVFPPNFSLSEFFPANLFPNFFIGILPPFPLAW